MFFGSLGCCPKDHNKSMQIRLPPHFSNKIRLLSCYLPTNIQLVNAHLCRVAVTPQVLFPHLLVCVANLISDMMLPIYFRFLIQLIDILKNRLKHF